MYIHIGSDFQVNSRDIIGIFDLDITSINDRTGKFLRNAEQNGIVVTLGDDLPKSFVVISNCNGSKIYLSPLSCQTLRRRTENN